MFLSCVIWDIGRVFLFVWLFLRCYLRCYFRVYITVVLCAYLRQEFYGRKLIHQFLTFEGTAPSCKNGDSGPQAAHSIFRA